MDRARQSARTIRICSLSIRFYLRNEFTFRNVHGIMIASGLLQTLTLQETRSIHDSMNIKK